MEENQQGITSDQFRVSHLRDRIAKVTVAYEDALSEAAVREQLLRQEVEQLRSELLNAQQELSSLKAQPEPMDAVVENISGN